MFIPSLAQYPAPESLRLRTRTRSRSPIHMARRTKSLYHTHRIRNILLIELDQL
jgi:hypothetical protein